MAKKKISGLLSLIILPNVCSVISCGKSSVERQTFSNDGEKNSKPKNTINKLKDDEEVRAINAQLNEIKMILRQGIDGSKDFTPSQSLADINVQNRIIEKVKQLCHNPENINFIPQLKSQYFKAGNENYVDVEIIYTKKDFQVSSMHHDLQIKNVKQDLEEVVEKALEDLKNPINFSQSFLIEHDDFNYENIKNEFIRVLNEQLEQEDERLSIELIDKNQELINHRQIEVKVIGKDDNEEIIKTIQVTPIRLLTVADYINALVINIPITREDKLFAYDWFYNPGYNRRNVKDKVFPKFNQLNSDQLRRRELALLDLRRFAALNINLTQGNSNFPISIKLKYNKVMTDIDLNLHDIENHPEFILNNVANYFRTQDLDLSNVAIFEDDDFNSDEVKNNIIGIMRSIKNTDDLDEKNDIKIQITQYLWYLPGYIVRYSHEYPNIIENWKDGGSWKINSVKLINIQKSPEQDLDDFMNGHIISSSIIQPITIPSDYFNDLNKYNLMDDLSSLKEDDAHLYSYLDREIREKSLSNDKTLNVHITPKKILSKKRNSINVEYEFKFKKSGRIASLSRVIEFNKW